MVQQLSDTTFTQEIINHKGVALVDFWAPWCGPCRMVAPVIDEISTEYAGQIKVGKLNVDENQRTAAQYGIMSIPTMIVFKDGKVVDKIIGAQPKQSIVGKLRPHLS